MGSSCQKWGNCKTYEHTTDDQAGRTKKQKHLKRFGRTNTVVNNVVNPEDMKKKESSAVVVRRKAQQHTMKKNDFKSSDLKVKIEKELVPPPQPYIQKKDEPEDIELKSLSPLNKDEAPETELMLLKEAFSRHFLLGNISYNAIDSILKEMDYFNLEADKTLFEQGDTGMHLFILTKGVLDVKVDGEAVSVIREGSAFGEIALVYSCKRTAQIINRSEESHLWTIHRNTFHRIMKNISDQTSFIRTNIVRELRVFSFIDRETRNVLSEHMIPMKFNKGDTIIRKGIQGILYLISRGSVRRQSSNNAKIQSNKVFKKGRILGFSTMIDETSLHESYIWETDVDCFNISNETLKIVFGEENADSIVIRLFLEDILEEKRISNHDTSRISSLQDDESKFEDDKRFDDDSSLLGSWAHFLERLTSEELDNLSKLLKLKKYKEGDLVYDSCKPDSEENLIMVVSGAIRWKVNDHIVKDYELIYKDDSVKEFFEDDMIAENFSITAEISLGSIKTNFGSEIAEIIDRSKKIKIIKSIYLFSLFSDDEILKILSKWETREYEKDDPIIQEGEDGNSLFMIAKGDVEIRKGGKFIRTLGKYEYFGERSLLFSEVRSASVNATKQVEVLVLNKKSFLNVIDSNIRQYLEYRIRLQDSHLDLSDLIIIDKLGYGNFGSVWKVMSAKNKTLYALKMVSRKKILEYDIEQNIKDEKKILSRIDHPFIMKLVKYYEEEHKIFFLTELVKGDDLFNALNYLNILDKSQGMFYFGSLLLITEYLHLRNILYRDFKPENIMIDETGYLKLIDFGAAKIIKDRTHTIIGTPSYTAPEVYIGEGYSYTADYWSLGVWLYEFLWGDLPFGGDNDMPDPLEVYKRILSGRLEFPSFYKDEEGKDLMRKMLHKDMVQRITTIDDIRSHQYCADFNFDDLIMRKIKAPYEPQIDDQILDPKNYQTFDELFRRDSRAMRMSFTNENGIDVLKNLKKK